MNYCIKGHKERGTEVIKLLESKDGKNLRDLVGDDPDFYYFIDKNDEIDCCTNTPYSTCILNAFCEELTLPKKEKWKPKFKVGDIVNYKIVTPLASRTYIGKIIAINSKEHSYKVDDDGLDYYLSEETITKWQPQRGETVLVKNSGDLYWQEAIFSFKPDDGYYYTVGGKDWILCIPFDENKLGKVTDE